MHKNIKDDPKGGSGVDLGCAGCCTATMTFETRAEKWMMPHACGATLPRKINKDKATSVACTSAAQARALQQCWKKSSSHWCEPTHVKRNDTANCWVAAPKNCHPGCAHTGQHFQYTGFHSDITNWLLPSKSWPVKPVQANRASIPLAVQHTNRRQAQICDMASLVIGQPAHRPCCQDCARSDRPRVTISLSGCA